MLPEGHHVAQLVGGLLLNLVWDFGSLKSLKWKLEESVLKISKKPIKSLRHKKASTELSDTMAVGCFPYLFLQIWGRILEHRAVTCMGAADHTHLESRQRATHQRGNTSRKVKVATRGENGATSFQQANTIPTKARAQRQGYLHFAEVQ